MIWIPIRPDSLLGLIWVQIVCTNYQQTIKRPLAGKDLGQHQNVASWWDYGTYCICLKLLFKHAYVAIWGTLGSGLFSHAFSRVLWNAESVVFLRQLLVLYAYIFLLGILIYAKKILLTRLKLIKNTWRRVQIWLPPQKIRRSPLIRCPRVFHKMSSQHVQLLTTPFRQQ